MRPHPATDLRRVYAQPPDTEAVRLEAMRAVRPSLREIARAGREGPEALRDMLDEVIAARDGVLADR